MKDMKLTTPEIIQLLSYVEERDRDGWYSGNKTQFQKRHESIKNKLIDALTGPEE